MHLQVIQLNAPQQVLLKTCLSVRACPAQVPVIPIAQFERYTLIKSLDFIRYRHKAKPTRVAKIIPYLPRPVLEEVGMITSVAHWSMLAVSSAPTLSISGLQL